MTSVFNRNGPYEIQSDRKTAKFRTYAWSKHYNMLYIDNPVGTGYSFTDDDRGLSNNESEVADNLFETLQQFFTLFSDYASNDFYLSGESYAGKYVPAIGYKTWKEGATAKYNLRGLIIGDGWTDPISQLHSAEQLYQLGFINEYERDLVLLQENVAENFLRVIKVGAQRSYCN